MPTKEAPGRRDAKMISGTSSARAQAKARGEKTFQGVPCKRAGHLERYTSNGACIVCTSVTDAAWYATHTEQAKATDAAWYAEHREQHNATGAAWHAEHREQRNADSAAWYASHTEQAKATSAAWYAAHREQNKATKAAYYAAHREQHNASTAAWYVEHREQKKATYAAWKAANPGAIRAKSAKYRALKKSQRCPVTCCTDKQIQHVYDIASLCGPGAHVDHIIPLELGGPHCVKNLVPMIAGEHIEKTSKLDAGLIAAARRKRKQAVAA